MRSQERSSRNANHTTGADCDLYSSHVGYVTLRVCFSRYTEAHDGRTYSVLVAAITNTVLGEWLVRSYVR